MWVSVCIKQNDATWIYVCINISRCFHVLGLNSWHKAGRLHASPPWANTGTHMCAHTCLPTEKPPGRFSPSSFAHLSPPWMLQPLCGLRFLLCPAQSPQCEVPWSGFVPVPRQSSPQPLAGKCWWSPSGTAQEQNEVNCYDASTVTGTSQLLPSQTSICWVIC